ncbi:hypothetical protein UFOVP368_32 [uncultured Caudovirales phage]|uniref:Uncharacterized protein n=1 Tax=uncultured Caudovirales phage TaxID=2100421 RepID=A0A6J7X0V0_9CAUD|nr:hypothetical protein UFOVP368_32 [uncultured Caudovirales phage]
MSDEAMEAAALRVCPDRCRVPCRTCARKASEAVTAYLAQREAEGFVMVPVEPTEAMADATDNHDNYWGYACNGQPWGPEDCYRAMLAARPQNGEA